MSLYPNTFLHPHCTAWMNTFPSATATSSCQNTHTATVSDRTVQLAILYVSPSIFQLKDFGQEGPKGPPIKQILANLSGNQLEGSSDRMRTMYVNLNPGDQHHSWNCLFARRSGGLLLLNRTAFGNAGKLSTVFIVV